MIIKCLPQFESLFYATLLSNLKGYSVVLKTTELNLFEKEDFIDIDSLNWKQIYEDHVERFGPILWYENGSDDAKRFKVLIESALFNKRPITKVMDQIKSAIKFGVQYVKV